jgi:hypothetical protein
VDFLLTTHEEVLRLLSQLDIVIVLLPPVAAESVDISK